MIDCWKCPVNTIDKCKHEEKYCNRYATDDVSRMPNLKEIEKIRQQEKIFWQTQQ